MIIRPREHWLRMLFVWKGSVLKTILPQLVFMLLVSLVAWRTNGQFFGERVTISFTLIGVTLAVFLGFRNNVSYARYWEARQLLGHIATNSRSLMAKIVAYLAPAAGDPAQHFFMQHLIAFPYALNYQLRGRESEDLPQLGREGADKGSMRTMHLLARMRGMLGIQHRQQVIDSQMLRMLDRHLDELSDLAGGCERIAATPFPYSYGLLLHRTVFAYCVLLPFGLADTLLGATPFVSVFVAYTLLALEEISNEIADPFGTSPNDLALDAICRAIERSVLDVCGEPLPPALVPDAEFVLT